MESVKVRELDEKSNVRLTDLVIIEDNDGTKTTKVANIASAVQQSLYFDTVEDMKNASLQDGDVVTTLGFYEMNDGGGATYKIKYAPAELQDKMFVHYLNTSDTLRAFLIHGKKIDALQVGARGDGITNDSKIASAILDNGYDLYLPYSEDGYYMSIYLKETFNNRVLDLNNSTIIGRIEVNGSNDSSARVQNITIKNAHIKCTSYDYGIVTQFSDNLTIENVFIEPVSYDSNYFTKGISILDSTNTVIKNCIIGTASIPIVTGIECRHSTSYNIDHTRIYTKNKGIINNTIKGTAIYKISNSEIQSYQDNTYGIDVSDGDKIIIDDCSFINLGIAINIAQTYYENEIIMNNCECMLSGLTDEYSSVLLDARSKNSIIRLNKVKLTNVNPFASRSGRIYIDSRYDKITDNKNFIIKESYIRSDCILVDSNDPAVPEFGDPAVAIGIITDRYTGPTITLGKLENCRVIITGPFGIDRTLACIAGGVTGQIIYLYKMNGSKVKILGDKNISILPDDNPDTSTRETYLSNTEYMKLQCNSGGIWTQIP